MSVEDYKETFSAKDGELAVNLLAEQVGNLESALFVLGEAITAQKEKVLDSHMYQQIYRMCMSWLLLTCTKVEELWKTYGAFASDETTSMMRSSLKEMQRRGVFSLRSKAIAHAIDKETGRPISPEELQEAIFRMMDDDWMGFFHWLRQPEDPKKDSVSRALRLFRADLQQAFPNARVTMPISTYRTAGGDVEF